MRISDWSSDVCSSDLLHLADVEQLLGLLDRLVDAGKSVIVIEHHQAVMPHADWIIDLGPGAGHDGGRVVFEGAPPALVSGRSTLTGEHLAAYLSPCGHARTPQWCLVIRVFRNPAIMPFRVCDPNRVVEGKREAE